MDKIIHQNETFNNISNTAILSDAKKPNMVVKIDGKEYLKVRVWVHELDRITGDKDQAWNEINDDFIQNERLPILEAKIEKLIKTNQDLQMYNKNIEYELTSKINTLKQSLKNCQELLEPKNAKIKALNEEYKQQLAVWTQKLHKGIAKRDKLQRALDDTTLKLELLEYNFKALNLEKSKLHDTVDTQNQKINKYLQDIMDLNDSKNLLMQKNEILLTDLDNQKRNAEIRQKTIQESLKNFYNNILNQKLHEMTVMHNQKIKTINEEFLNSLHEKNQHIASLQEALCKANIYQQYSLDDKEK